MRYTILLLAIMSSCQSPLDLQTLLDEELVAYPNDYHAVDLSIPLPDNLERAFRKYESGDFLEAQVFLREYRQLYHTQLEVDFYLAQTYIGQEKYDVAKEMLEHITGSGRYYTQALWYRVLILARQGQLDAAQKLLKSFLLIAPQQDFKVNKGSQLMDLLTQA